MDLWTGPLTRAPRLSAFGAHLWMAGWTTLRVDHAPTHRPSAAHKLHRAPPQEMQKNKQYKQYPARRSGIAGPTTSAKEATNQPAHTHSYNLNRATQHQAPRSVTLPKSPVTFAEIRIQVQLDGHAVQTMLPGYAHCRGP